MKKQNSQLLIILTLTYFSISFKNSQSKYNLRRVLIPEEKKTQLNTGIPKLNSRSVSKLKQPSLQKFNSVQQVKNNDKLKLIPSKPPLANKNLYSNRSRQSIMVNSTQNKEQQKTQPLKKSLMKIEGISKQIETRNKYKKPLLTPRPSKTSNTPMRSREIYKSESTQNINKAQQSLRPQIFNSKISHNRSKSKAANQTFPDQERSSSVNRYILKPEIRQNSRNFNNQIKTANKPPLPKRIIVNKPPKYPKQKLAPQSKQITQPHLNLVQQESFIDIPNVEDEQSPLNSSPILKNQNSNINNEVQEKLQGLKINFNQLDGKKKFIRKDINNKAFNYNSKQHKNFSQKVEDYSDDINLKKNNLNKSDEESSSNLLSDLNLSDQQKLIEADKLLQSKKNDYGNLQQPKFEQNFQAHKHMVKSYEVEKPQFQILKRQPKEEDPLKKLDQLEFTDPHDTSFNLMDSLTSSEDNFLNNVDQIMEPKKQKEKKFKLNFNKEKKSISELMERWNKINDEKEEQDQYRENQILQDNHKQNIKQILDKSLSIIQESDEQSMRDSIKHSDSQEKVKI